MGKAKILSQPSDPTNDHQRASQCFFEPLTDKFPTPKFEPSPCAIRRGRGKLSIGIRDGAHVLAGVLAWSGIRLDRLGLLAWAEVFGLMRMLRTAAAAPAHNAREGSGHFVARFLQLEGTGTGVGTLVYAHCMY